MFSNLPPSRADSIMALMAAYQADNRPAKIDLGVGVYRDASGQTPVMGAVKRAEARVIAAQTTKSYLGLRGDPQYLAAIRNLVLPHTDPARVASSQTPGGTGALFALFRLALKANPHCRFWLPDVGWPNHEALLEGLGANIAYYRYLDIETNAVDEEGMLDDLSRAQRDDVVLLHGCCHNPTGADPQPSTWHDIAKVLSRSGAVPLVDMAYQGLGDGLQDDLTGLGILQEHLETVMVAVSCSKTFGVYRDRVGAALVVSDPIGANSVIAALTAFNRLTYSFAPSHGASVIKEVLTDIPLRTAWKAELDEMRHRIVDLRHQLHAALSNHFGPEEFSYLLQHKGMFSRIGLSPAEVERLREDFAIYMTPDARINIAGLSPNDIPYVVGAISELD